MDYISKIEFIIFSEFEETSPEIAETFTEVFNSDLDIKTVATKYSTLKFEPRSLSFDLKLGSEFFDTFTNPENYINEINRYFIKCYDEKEDLFFRGLIYRNDFSIDNETGIISIDAKDLSLLFSLVQNTIITPVDVLVNELTNIENLYNYYLDLGLKYYFGDSFDTTDYKSLDYDDDLLNVSDLEYTNDDLTIQDLVNLFFSVNSHILRYEESTNKIIIDNANRFNFNLPEIAISDNDIFDEKEGNVNISKLNNSKLSDNLSDDPDYSSNVKEIILLNDANYNAFTSSVYKKVTTNITKRITDYSLSLNQVVRYLDNFFSIKGILEKSKYYNLILWNSRSPFTNNTFMIPTNQFWSISRVPNNNNILLIPTNEITANKDNNKIIIVPTNEIISNTDNNNLILISTNKGIGI